MLGTRKMVVLLTTTVLLLSALSASNALPVGGKRSDIIELHPRVARSHLRAFIYTPPVVVCR